MDAKDNPVSLLTTNSLFENSTKISDETENYFFGMFGLEFYWFVQNQGLEFLLIIMRQSETKKAEFYLNRPFFEGKENTILPFLKV